MAPIPLASYQEVQRTDNGVSNKRNKANWQMNK